MLQEWTKAETTAWEYIESAISSGIKASSALKQYRAAGGSIRTQNWYSTYNKLESSANEWNTLKYLNKRDTVPESLYADTPNKYQNKYVTKFTVSIIDEFTGKPVTLNRQVGFDNRPTLQELDSVMNEYMQEDKSQPAERVVYITDLKFYKRVGA